MRPVLKRKGKPIQLTTEEIKLLDDLWALGKEITELDARLVVARKTREKLVRKAKERRFLNREIAEIGSLSQAGVHYIVAED